MSKPDIVSLEGLLCARGAARVRMPLGARWSLRGTPLRLALGGTVDVFARYLSNDQGPGALLHVGRFHAGAAIFPISAQRSGVELIAVVSADTDFVEIDLKRLAIGASVPDLPPIAGMLEHWIAVIGRELALRDQPAGQHVLEVGSEHDLKAGQIVSARDVCWLQGDGASLSCLRDSRGYAPSADQPFVLAPGLWATVIGPGHVRCRPTEDVLASLGTKAVECWSALLLALVADRLAARDAGAARRRIDRSRQDQVAIDASVAAIAAVARPAADAAGLAAPRLDPLAAALHRIGRHMGFAVASLPAEREDMALDEKLWWLIRESHLRVREVSLRAAAWRRDGMPLLVFTQEDERPCVALPDAGGRWQLVDPVTAERCPLTEESAPDLQPRGFMIYRSLPEALTPWQVVRFTFTGSRRDIGRVVALSALVAALGLVTPIATKVIVDEIIPQAERQYLGQIILVLAAVALGTALFELARAIALVRVEGRGSAQLQAGIWDRILRLPSAFFRGYSVGDLAMRVFGVELIRHLVSGVAIGALLGGVFSAVNLVLMLYFDWRLGLLAGGLATVVLGSIYLATRLQLDHLRRVMMQAGRVTGIVVQLLSGIAKLRVAAAETRAFRYWAEAFAEQRRYKYQADTLRNRVTIIAGLLPLLFAIVVFAGIGMRNETIDTGTFVAFNAALGQFVLGMVAVAGALSQALQAVPLYERLGPILEAAPEPSQATGMVEPLAGAIEVNAVSFRYAPTGPLVLNDVSFQVQPGEFVAFVGPSGSGKSTLFRILLGFETPTTGTVYYDGRDLRRLDVRAVRQQLGVVLQDAKLSPGTILENIVGASRLTANDAMEAVRMAGMEADLEAMPMGLQTFVAEGAGTLSGGQRQRLMIARALVRRPTILLFDEATSALDNETQAIVSRSLERLNVTRIAIAHRLSTIQNADRIYVIQAGQIVQQGSFAELMAEPGVFRELAERQIT
jgi:NHLM bacteriocin system ABC transporter ATP-binding protein